MSALAAHAAASFLPPFAGGFRPTYAVPMRRWGRRLMLEPDIRAPRRRILTHDTAAAKHVGQGGTE